MPLAKKSPLGKARNHGSAKSGTHHYIMQRVSAIGLLILGPWFFYHVLITDFTSFGAVVMWLQNPGDVAFLALFIGFGLYHGFLGLQVVIEDYVHSNPLKISSLLVLKFLMITLGIMVLFTLMHIQSIDPSTFDTSEMTAITPPSLPIAEAS